MRLPDGVTYILLRLIIIILIIIIAGLAIVLALVADRPNPFPLYLPTLPWMPFALACLSIALLILAISVPRIGFLPQIKMVKGEIEVDRVSYQRWLNTSRDLNQLRLPILELTAQFEVVFGVGDIPNEVELTLNEELAKRIRAISPMNRFRFRLLETGSIVKLVGGLSEYYAAKLELPLDSLEHPDTEAIINELLMGALNW